jgi:hypothetical protein
VADGTAERGVFSERCPARSELEPLHGAARQAD